MNTFVRSYNKCGSIKPQSFATNKKFSTVYYRPRYSYLQSIANNGQQRDCISSYKELPQNYYLPISSVTSYTINAYSYNSQRHFHPSQRRYEGMIPSSKVEVSVQAMKNKQKEKVEEIMKEAATSGTTKTAEIAEAAVQADAITAVAKSVEEHKKLVETVPKPVAIKKPLKTRIWEEIVHYYHGFRLLFIDINICRKMLWRVLNGKTLSRRENKLLVRTTSDVFRLIPFSVFIIVPFMELLLPVFIKFFPGMLPSTFQTAKEREDKLKQSVQVRLEMVKFLQKTLDEMAVQHKEHKSEDAKQFELFFQKIKTLNEYVSTEEIIKFAKRFDDEITLDSLSRQQMAALCRVLNLNTLGTSNLLRFQLRVKLRSLAADDRVIAREGVNSLDLWELQNACKARGMRAYGLTADHMRQQLQEWIDLSLNEKVPPTLLLLSRTMLVSDDTITTDKLKETIRSLPESLATQTKAAIGEREGKIDNKTKIEIIKEEERKIKEEREEERLEAKAAIQDKAPVIDSSKDADMVDAATLLTDKAAVLEDIKPTVSTVLNEDESRKEAADVKAKDEEEKSLTSKDVELLNEALKSLSSDKKMVVEKETIRDLKEELEEYKEDVEELREVRQVVKEPVRESRAAKILFKKVNSMIGQLDKTLDDLEKQKAADTDKLEAKENLEIKEKMEEIVQITDLVAAIKKMKQTSAESRLKQIENVLSKLDADKDGAITVEEVLKVVEAIGRENVKLNDKQLEELISLLDKEQLIEAEEKIVKAIEKSVKEAEEIRRLKEHESIIASPEIQSELMDCAKAIKDTNTLVLDEIEKQKPSKEEQKIPTEFQVAADKQKEKILPKGGDIAAKMPPAIPTPPKTTPANSNKNKMI